MDLPYFKFYPAETLADERFSVWTHEQRGVWLTLVLHAWVNGSIPASEVALARILHVDATAFRSLWDAIGDRFEHLNNLPPDRLSSPRLEREREEVLERSEAGKKGAKHRWSKGKNKDATAMRPQCDRNATASGTAMRGPMPLRSDQIRSDQRREEQKSETPPLKSVESHRLRNRTGVGGYATPALQHWSTVVWPALSTVPAPEPELWQTQKLAALSGQHGPEVVTTAMDAAAKHEFWRSKLTLANFLNHFEEFLPRRPDSGSGVTGDDSAELMAILATVPLEGDGDYDTMSRRRDAKAREILAQRRNGVSHG